MFINEAVLKQKTVYDKVIDKLGTEEEYSNDLAKYIISDTYKSYNSLSTALKYIFQERNSLSSLKLLSSVFFNITVFRESFQDSALSCVVNKNSDLNYFVDTLNLNLKSNLDANNNSFINFSIQNKNTAISQIKLESLIKISSEEIFYIFYKYISSKLKNEQNRLYIQTTYGKYYIYIDYKESSYHNWISVYDSDGHILLCINTDFVYLFYKFI